MINVIYVINSNHSIIIVNFIKYIYPHQTLISLELEYSNPVLYKCITYLYIYSDDSLIYSIIIMQMRGIIEY